MSGGAKNRKKLKKGVDAIMKRMYSSQHQRSLKRKENERKSRRRDMQVALESADAYR